MASYIKTANDNNLNSRYTNLINSDYWGSLSDEIKKEKVNQLKELLEDRSDVNLKSIKTLTGENRNQFKNLLTGFENEKKTVEKTKRQEKANKEFGEQQAKKQEDIIGKSLLQDGNKELGDYVNTLVFFGTGTGGKSLGRDVKMDDVMLMKNSTYYACITGVENKEISSLSNNPEVVKKDSNETRRIEEIIKIAKKAFVSIEKSKEEDRSKLNEISKLLKGAILPKGINIDFSNRTNQSIQMIIGFNKIGDSINASGRIQFVPRIGNIKSSVITIEDSEYSFDSSKIEENQQDQSVKQVIERLIGPTIKPKEPAVITGGKKRNTYRKKKTSKGKRSKVAKKTRKTRRKMKH
tara:strand:+ start:8551 stop:9603 length:1053 start_codon:yes stop_codon:yes gene_type:complete